MTLIRSIKHQAVALFVSFAVGLTLLYLGLAVVASFVVEDNIIYRLLQFEANHVEQQYAITGELPTPRMDFIQLYQNQSELPQFVISALSQGIDDNEIFAPGEEHFHIQELHLNNGDTGYLLAEVSSLLTVTKTLGIFETFAWGLALTLIIAVLLAYKMAGLTVKPVMAMIAAMKAGKPLPQSKYELGYLSRTVTQALSDLKQSLQREKDFSTDVSHELRTPLTVLHNTVALAQQRGFEPDDLTRLKQAGQEMQHTIDVLLALARRETLASERCLLKPMVEQTAMNCVIAAGVEFDLQINMADDFAVEANPSLLQLLLTNLINNAITHGSDKRLWLKGHDQHLQFHNLTSEQLTDDIMKSGVKSQQSKGIGQGLYLVTRIIDALGWQHQLQRSNSYFSINISL
ncbi:hypothetical protein GCM10011369_32480 [Neiella marina]|uniref:histidine kinase n=1 Tax=Neiella marina TaxID=508461 RepID=A0A8J2U9G8_9GAMM|nr:histidine kinase dimerization/phospho-acceptor domain-containing protein [Neiella marina]GGA87901.1 hypothetical protein GCM10011369_32480 [Neiella marina]